jgi:hypothetical protein
MEMATTIAEMKGIDMIVKKATANQRQKARPGRSRSSMLPISLANIQELKRSATKCPAWPKQEFNASQSVLQIYRS